VKLTLIPSCVGGGPEPHQFASSCLINDTVVLDAGCIGFHGSAQDQARIKHVLVSHTHMDHIASLPIFIENAYEAKPDCVTVHASAAVLDGLQRDLFNDRVWPDFIALSRSDKPFVKLSAFEAGQTIVLEGLRVKAVAIDHVVPTVGYIVADAHSAIAFISDTGPTDEIWQHVNREPNLQAVFLESCFPNSLDWLAVLSKHLTPAKVARELAKLTRPVRAVMVHIKARYQAQVIQELHALNLPNLEIAQFGTPYVF
jgi:ribonuclease BN (tRNA processing enzyme)